MERVQTPDRARPNIVWIMADELRTLALACYGGAPVPVATPNIDALAARGVLFEQHFCNSPACVPSRTSMLTCKPPTRTGVYSNEGAWKSYPLPSTLPTFPQTFAANGYDTVSLGKSHYPHAYRPWATDRPEGGGMHIFGLDENPADLEPIVPDGIPSPVGGTYPADRFYPPETVTRNALDWLGGPHERPFLLRVSYLQPHTPVLPPEFYRRMYDAADFPGHDLPRGHGSLYEETFAEIVGGRRLTHAQMQRAQADYQALVTWLDFQVGLLVAMLRTRGMLDNTIIMFNADHGASIGENGLLSKVVHAPQSHRVPLVFSAPGRLPEGERRKDICEALDLGRTLCGLAGIDPDPAFEGRDLFAQEPPHHIFSVVGNGEKGSRASAAANTGGWPDGGGWPRRMCVRTRKYRFDMNVRQDGQPIAASREDRYLADVENDPREIVNLAEDPAYAGIVSELRDLALGEAANGVEPDHIPEFSPDEAGEFLPPRIGD